MRQLPAKLHHHLAGKTGASARVVIIALVGDILVAAIKFVAGYLSGSSAMTSEGVHTLIDASTEVILLYGLVNSRRKATPEHQLGFGREVYFWNFVVAVLILALGSGIAFVAGLHQIQNPVPLEKEWLNFTVLACAGVIEIGSLWAAFKKTSSSRGKQSLYRLLSRRRDPTSLTIFFGGIAAVVGLIVTAIGLVASMLTGNAAYDGLASVAIAIILAVTACKLAVESKSLLIGVPADQEVVKSIIDNVKADKAVHTVNGMISVHLSPDQILVALSVAFDESLDTRELENAISGIEAELHRSHPIIVALFIKPQSPEQYAEIHGGGAPVTCFANVRKVAATPYASM